jgi:sugar phosphate isomerase/epimerase
MNLPTLLHSVSYSGSWGQCCLTLDQFIDKAADLGFEGVMLMAKPPHLSLLNCDAKRRRDLRAHLEKRRLRHVCVAAYNNFTGDWEHPDIPHFEIQVHYLTELARLTADLGGNALRIFTGYEHSAGAFVAQWQFIVKAIKECCRRAAEFGVTIGVQNHHDIATGFESQYELIRAVDEPNCRAFFDAWAPALHGADLETAAAKMGPITTHTTVANYQCLPRYRYETGMTNFRELSSWMQAVPTAEGFIDYEKFLSALCAAGFQGTVAYEMCSQIRGGGSIENLDDYARNFLECMERFSTSGVLTASRYGE